MMNIKKMLVSAHSEMRCAKYDIATGKCYAPIRNQGVAYLQEAYSFYNGAAICQSPMTNPISASYGNGAGCPDYANCPDQMGSFSAGETFTVMWFARNHAVADQSPATVFLYLSPKENANQNGDISQAAMEVGKICQGPYMNCNGQNGDTVPCTLTCTMPSNLASGTYTMWWKWIWQGGAMYATCADINVAVTSNTVPVPAITTGKAPVTTGKPPITTGKPSVTTGKAPVTTGKAPVTTSKAPVTTSKLPVTTAKVPVTTAKLPATTAQQPVTTGGVPATSSTTSSTIGTGVVLSTSGAEVNQTTTSSSGSTAPCTYGEMTCASDNTYQTCALTSDGTTAFGPIQACGTGLSCHPAGIYIYCY